MIKTLTAAGREYLEKHHGLPASASLDQARALVGELVATGKMTPDQVRQLDGMQPTNTVKNEVQQMITKAVSDAMKSSGAGSHTTNKGGLGHIMEPETNTIRVKAPSERYLTTKSIAKHAKTGEPVTLAGTPVYSPSQLELAQIGVFWKACCNANAQYLGKYGLAAPEITEHDEQLLKEMAACGLWRGTTISGRHSDGETLANLGCKALLNDVTSGGASLVPAAFDEMLVTFPLLHSELLPLIDLRATNRDEVNTASIGNPSVTWGVADGSAMTPFTTDNLVGPISAAVENVTCAMEIGRDILIDSPVDIGAMLAENIGQAFAAELDDVIATGSGGSSQPEGIFTASGTIAVDSENGSTGPWTMEDIESLLFAVPKQYRIPSMNCAFISNDVTYSRWRGLALGVADQRRLLGMDHESYSILSRPHRINASIGNRQAAFVALKRYRMWRRAGVELRFETGGRELTLKNLALLVARGRYAGMLVDGSAAAVCEDGQS